ncbi:hypothetical protein LINGRAHAP2_LOCUS21613, partial [Linum grandiflorum]
PSSLTPKPQLLEGITMKQKFQHFPLGNLWKTILLSSIFLFLFYTFTFHYYNANILPTTPLLPLQHKWSTTSTNTSSTRPTDQVDFSPTDLSHVGFVVIGSLRTWRWRKHYIESWWRPNVTKGFLFLDKEPTPEFLPWNKTSPPYRVSTDFTGIKVYAKLANPPQIRMVRAILDMYRQAETNNRELRWFVMCDDDTLLLVDNLIGILNKFDHTKYQYIGGTSECIASNAHFSFEMGFGGAGYALSYPLVEALSSELDGCIERYPHVYVSDALVQACLADLGVAVTHQKGFHQLDLHGDISGLLSAHPQSPLVSLHHFDFIDPIFPSMGRSGSIQHFMKAAEIDQSRISQQTICYQRQTNWSLSVAWGYSAYIYENIIPRSSLILPFETFKPWNPAKFPAFMFNTRWLSANTCESPHVFFFKSLVGKKNLFAADHVVTTYARNSTRDLTPCSMAGNHSANHVDVIQVTSPAASPKMAGVMECCDVDYKAGSSIMDIRIRNCLKGEVLA